MIAAALLALSLLGPPDDVVARLRAEPADVQVGEACRLVLEVEHAEGTTVRLPETDPVADDSWVLLEPRRITRSDPTTLVATWSVLSLEAGSRKLPSLSVDLLGAGGTRKVEVEAGSVEVRPALASGEDAPRPMRGFREAPPPRSATGGRLVLLGLLALAVAAVVLALRRRARRKVAPVAAPSPLDVLAGLERRAAEDPEASRAVVYDLSRLLRTSIDRFLREDRAAVVDAEWAARLEADERVPLGARRSIARILNDSARIKYALQAPTRFALQEMLAAAKNALEALATAPPPAAAPSAAADAQEAAA